jgi:hypothetical protein
MIEDSILRAQDLAKDFELNPVGDKGIPRYTAFRSSE